MGNNADRLVMIFFCLLGVVTVSFYTLHLKSVIQKLKNDNLELSIDVANLKRESDSFRKVVDAQNKHIDALIVDNVRNMQELDEWKKLPPKIKYRTITKFKEVLSDECKDIKASLDNIRNNGVK